MSKKTKKTKPQHILERLGLGENEAELYLLMLKYPKSTVQELQQKSPFPRTMLYYVLNNLVKYELVTPIKQKWKTVYKVEDPEHLRSLLEKRRDEFERDRDEVRALIPELRQTYRLSHVRPEIQMFEGLDQYTRALEDVFSTRADIMYAYVASEYMNKPGRAIRDEFDNARTKKGIMLHLLAGDSQTATLLKKQYKNQPLVQIRVVDTKHTISALDFRLYSGKILYTRYDIREPIVMLMEDRDFYRLQKELFTSLWETARKIK